MPEAKDPLANSSNNKENCSVNDNHNNNKANCQKYMQWSLRFIVQHYLPISLITAVAFGMAVPAPGVYFNHKATVYVCVSVLLLYSGLYLQTSAMKDAMKIYKAYIWGTISILCVTCILGGQLTRLLNQNSNNSNNNNNNNNNNNASAVETHQNISSLNDTEGDLQDPLHESWIGPHEFQIGVILYTSMPCSVGTGIIMVQHLKGHAALAILLTVVTNMAGVFTIPLYVSWLIMSDVKVPFNIGDITLKLFIILFIPLVVGKIMRINKKVRECISVPKHKAVLKIIALSCLAFILLIKASQSSYDGSTNRMTPRSVVVTMFWSLTIHLLFLLVNTIAVCVLRLPVDQKKCIVLLASQKTLSQAVATAVYLPQTLGDQGLIAVSMVFCHITTLVFDSLLIPLWLYLEERFNTTEAGEEELQMVDPHQS